MITTNGNGGSKDEFWKMKRFYVGVSPTPQLIYTNLSKDYPIYLGSLAWICVLLKIVVFIENW